MLAGDPQPPQYLFYTIPTASDTETTGKSSAAAKLPPVPTAPTVPSLPVSSVPVSGVIAVVSPVVDSDSDSESEMAESQTNNQFSPQKFRGLTTENTKDWIRQFENYCTYKEYNDPKKMALLRSSWWNQQLYGLNSDFDGNYITVRLASESVDALVDTGVVRSLINEELVKDLKLHIITKTQH